MAAKPQETQTQEPGTDSFAYKVKNRVALPILSMKNMDEKPLFIQIIHQFYEGKPIRENGEMPEKGAILTRVHRIVDGKIMSDSVFELVCNTVLHQSIEEKYPDESYVGKCFRIIQQPKAEGKRYKTYLIDEIELG